MQVIIHVEPTVEHYVEQDFHRRVRPPERCGNCGALATLKGLGYYSRYTTGARGDPVRFWVARFICAACELTTSCLPSFAQPYRLVANKTIQAFVEGHSGQLDVRRCEGWLKRYLKRFQGWQKFLRGMVGNRFGRGPPKETATAFWRRAVAACGSLAELTLRLVQEFATTCFGTYRCHQPSHAQ
jgi:hypothetical protein